MAAEQRKQLIKEIEDKRGSRVICCLTSDRENAQGQIAKDFLFRFFQHLRTTPNLEKLDVLLFTLGGDTLAAYALARLVRQFAKTIGVLIPHLCLSGGTLISLAADEIVMTRLATWGDVNFTAGEIHLSRGVVRQHVGQMKTEASRKPIPMDERLADVLIRWREEAPYNQDGDYIFASPDKRGTQPYWPTAGMEDHVRPAAQRAGIQKQVGWHTFRHTFGTLVNSKGADVATTQALMRHANASITMDRYVQAVTPAKREAQSRLVQAIPFPTVPTQLTEVAVTD